jgi:tetratricopeptide (TPR) repeat protein
MEFDTNNKIIQLCAQGMEMEARQKPQEAKALFWHAWNEASNDFEKFTAAHYVARHQKSVQEKLEWDKTALSFALKIKDDSMKANYPSLYLNIAKCYEDLKDLYNAQINYQLALTYIEHLPVNGYGEMIKLGIKNGIKRISK